MDLAQIWSAWHGVAPESNAQRQEQATMSDVMAGEKRGYSESATAGEGPRGILIITLAVRFS